MNLHEATHAAKKKQAEGWARSLYDALENYIRERADSMAGDLQDVHERATYRLDLSGGSRDIPDPENHL